MRKILMHISIVSACLAAAGVAVAYVHEQKLQHNDAIMSRVEQMNRQAASAQ